MIAQVLASKAQVLRRIACGGGMLTLLVHPLDAQRPGPPGAAFTRGTMPDTMGVVMIHPVIGPYYSCSEHAFHATTPVVLGDALGMDCVIVRYDFNYKTRKPPTYFDQDGSRNEDWHGWNKPVFAPFDATIEEIHVNPVVNTPGTLNPSPSSYTVFVRSDSTNVSLGHVQHFLVRQGDKVTAGQQVASVGNNGFSYMPHTHLGAWPFGVPLQIRFDLRALGKMEGGQ